MQTMKTEKETYIAPAITVVRFKVEQGFQASGIPLFLLLRSTEESHTESFSTHDDWGTGGDNSFWE